MSIPQDMTMAEQWETLLRQNATLHAEVEKLKEEKASAISTLDAWFDRRQLGHNAVDETIIAATKGYLRRSQNGGMPSELADVALSVVVDMARLGAFADIYARLMPHLSRESEALIAEIAVLQRALTKMLNAVCGETGFAAAVRQATGTAFPWPALDEAEEASRAALARPAAPKPFDLIRHIHRQREFSRRTFGPGERTQGVLDHIRKELGEIEREPHDLTEWIDIMLLAIDGAWRHGHEPEDIAAALEAKLTKNENRTWPDWRTMPTDKAIEHDRTGETS